MEESSPKRGPHFPGTHASLCEWLVLKSKSDLPISSHKVPEKRSTRGKANWIY